MLESMFKKCVQTLSSELNEVTLCLQVVDLLRYFSWAEPQLKAMKALQHVSDSLLSPVQSSSVSFPHLCIIQIKVWFVLEGLTYIPLYCETPITVKSYSLPGCEIAVCCC